MGKEVERKFLVEGRNWPKRDGITYRQGYLATAKEKTVRVRLVGDKKAYLTIKGENIGATRSEFEYEIPVDDAKELLENLCEKPLIEKKRYKVEYGELTWEIDQFFGENEGLILAEVELEDEEQSLDRPEWLGEEVTDDPRYYNANLAKKPFNQW